MSDEGPTIDVGPVTVGEPLTGLTRKPTEAELREAFPNLDEMEPSPPPAGPVANPAPHLDSRQRLHIEAAIWPRGDAMSGRWEVTGEVGKRMTKDGHFTGERTLEVLRHGLIYRRDDGTELVVADLVYGPGDVLDEDAWAALVAAVRSHDTLTEARRLAAVHANPASHRGGRVSGSDALASLLDLLTDGES